MLTPIDSVRNVAQAVWEGGNLPLERLWMSEPVLDFPRLANAPDEANSSDWQPGDVLFFAGRGLTSWIIWLGTLPPIVYLIALIPWLILLKISPAFNPDAAICTAFIVSVAIFVVARCFSRRITHTAIVGHFRERLAIYESTSPCRLPCLLSGKRVKGGQVQNISFRIADYDGEVYLARLVPDEQLSPDEATRLRMAAFSYLGTPYSRLGAVLSGTTLIDRVARVHGFCSQLVYSLLKKVDRAPMGIHSATVHPAGLARILERTEEFDPLRRIK